MHWLSLGMLLLFLTPYWLPFVLRLALWASGYQWPEDDKE